MLKQNVDVLRVIQMGVTLANAREEWPRETHINLRFTLAEDRYNADSINLLLADGIGADHQSGSDVD